MNLRIYLFAICILSPLFFGNVCFAQGGRDRSDQADMLMEMAKSQSFDEFLELCIECGAEYYYIMKDGEWYCGDMYAHTPLSISLTLLTEALANEKETEHA